MEKKKYSALQLCGLILGPVVAVIFCLIHIPGLEDLGTRVLGLTLWMVIWWVSSAVPIWITSFLPIAGGILMNIAGTSPLENGLNTYGSYGAAVTVMCIGVFVLGAVIERWNLHRRIALGILSIMGGRPGLTIFGFGLATAVISMFMSNTTAVAMLIPIAMALLSQLNFGQESGFAKALLLNTAFAGSIGGMATSIGSGTNLAAIGLFKELVDVNMSFTDWLTIGLPFMVILLPLSVFALCKVYKVKEADLGSTQLIKDELAKLGKMGKGEKIAAVYTIVAILVFIFNDQIATLIPWLQFLTNEGWGVVILVLAFVIPVDLKNGEFLMDTKTAVQKISWSTFILLGGALTLGGMFSKAGVAAWIASKMGFLASWPQLLTLIFICILVSVITEAVSNFVVVAAFLPAMVGLADTIGMNPMFLLMAVTLSASLAFMLPTGTPPNALIFSSGMIEVKDLMKGGLVVKVIGIIVFPIVMYFIARPLSPLF